MNTEDFNFELPKELIAQFPAEKRDNCKLLVYDRNTQLTKHLLFNQLIDNLTSNDVLVINNSKVIPARILFYFENKQFEIFLVKKISNNIFDCIIRPGKKFKINKIFNINNSVEAKIIDSSEIGRIIEFTVLNNKNLSVENALHELGEIPLPPYITEFNGDINLYQTTYSKINGSTAAPTAGLHFTKNLLNEIKTKISDIVEVTLHIGPGTFKPVKTSNLKEHKMHSEFYSIDQKTFEKLKKYKEEKKRIIAVGTTSVRVLETIFSSYNSSLTGETDIFIYPGYKYKFVDALITNFHLPKSTLLMLVSALCSRKEILKIYNEAIEKKYRFFSFGDAMFIV